MLDLRLKLTLAVLDVLVAFHRVRLARTSLAIREYSRVIAVNHLLNHAFDANLLVETLLVDGAVGNFVELVSFRGLVARIEL